MKTKAMGALSIGMMVVGLAAAVGNIAWKYDQGYFKASGPALQSPDTKTVASLTVDRKAAGLMSALETRLGELRHPRVDVPGTPKFAQFGFGEEAVAQLARSKHLEAAQAERPFDSYRLTLAYVSGAHRFAVIDGIFYREGESIGASDIRVQRITLNRVLLAGGGSRQWIDVGAAPVVASAEGGETGEEAENADLLQNLARDAAQI